MQCNDFQELISGYIDGELELGEQAQVEHHLSACGPCRIVRDDLLQIVHFSRRLPEDMPSSSIWLGICSEIEAAKPASRLAGLWMRISEWEFRFSGRQLAAGSFSAVVVVAMIVALSQWRDSVIVPLDRGTEPPARAAVEANLEDIEQRIGQLQAVVEQRRRDWQPQVCSFFDRNMLYIDQSLAECRQSLRANPYDDVSQELMLNAYREKVRLLEGFSDY